MTEVPTDGVEFDTGEFAGDNSEGTNAAPPGTNYEPPKHAEASAAKPSTDIEMGEVSQMKPDSEPNTTPIVDLLDANPIVSVVEPEQTPGAINELD